MGIRTTVTLDEDVLHRLKQESHLRGTPVKQTLNELLRNALLTRDNSQKREFHITPWPGKLREDLNYDDIQGLFDYLDGPGSK